jgi:alkylated DNA nucleotide flippase Atl1
MKVSQTAAYLQEQETPGNHRVINRRGDCAEFDARAQKRSLLSRILRD